MILVTFSLLLLLLTPALSKQRGPLRDHAVVGAEEVLLDGLWQLYPTAAGAPLLQATVPGDLVTDLYEAGLVPDPLFEYNFLNYTYWWGRGWAGL